MALQLRIASPCSEPWDAMVGDARVRRCAACKLNVFNARELTEVELVAMLKAANGGRMRGTRSLGPAIDRLWPEDDVTMMRGDIAPPTGPGGP